MNAAAVVGVQLGDRSYSIQVGSGLLGAPASYQSLPRGSGAVIVTNDTVGALYAKRLGAALKDVYPKLDCVVVADGEAFKTWQTLQKILDGLIDARADRSTTVIALGGGVIGDLAGFAAASYMRGVGYVQVPTTLLAHGRLLGRRQDRRQPPAGKNLIGAFHQPLAVIADVDVLEHAAGPRVRRGLAEVIKYGAVADDGVPHVGRSDSGPSARDKLSLVQAVTRSLPHQGTASSQRRARSRAPRDPQLRPHLRPCDRDRYRPRHLASWRSGRLRHGDGRRSVGSSRLDRAGHSARIARVVAAAGLSLRAPRLGVARYVKLMRMDKKAEAGHLRFVVFAGPGQAVVRGAPAASVTATIEAFGG